MNRQYKESEYRTAAILAILPKIAPVALFILMLVVNCVGTKPDPMDHSYNKSREVIAQVRVMDSTLNGFRVVYASTNNITNERLQEMKNRESFVKTIARLKEEAPIYFGGSLLETDIYDFARYVIQFKVDEDYTLHNIFISGKEKCNLYIGPNPKIDKPARWIDPGTEQGIQYIKAEDIYSCTNGGRPIYRYWKCYGNQDISFTDERFSHFSEEERIR